MWTLLAACQDPPPRRPEPLDAVATLSEPGPYAVGYREESVTWTGALDADARTLRLAAWFPTEAETGLPVRYLDLFDAPGVLGGASPVGGPLPLAVFSHGHQGYAENSSFLAVHLASHGWLVLAPDHTGNTTFDDPTRTTDIYWERPMDVSAVIDHAEATWDTTGEVGVLGHSFGGYTVHAVGGATYDPAVLAACADGSDTSEFCSTMTPSQQVLFVDGFADARVQAIVAMAAGDYRLFGAAGVRAIGLPDLVMEGGLDPGDADEYVAALDGADDRHLFVTDAGHQAFTDYSGLLGDPEGAIDPEEGWRIVRTYALAFLRVHVLGEREWQGILDGSDPVSALAAIAPAG